MVAAIRERFLPGSVLAWSPSPEFAVDLPIPLIKGRPLLDERATAYVCHRGRCAAPVNNVAALIGLVENEGVARP